MEVEFICDILAELFDYPYNFSPCDEELFEGDNCTWCEEHCGKAEAADCWYRYFEIKKGDEKFGAISVVST